jgi:hypothetical protein
MNLSSGFNPQPFNQKTLDVGVDILLRGLQAKLPLLMERFYFPQFAEDLLPILFGQEALMTEHEDVCAISPKIIWDQSFIAWGNPLDIPSRKKIDRFLGGQFFKPAAP